jgi:hypothetical protein
VNQASYLVSTNQEKIRLTTFSLATKTKVSMKTIDESEMKHADGWKDMTLPLCT